MNTFKGSNAAIVFVSLLIGLEDWGGGEGNWGSIPKHGCDKNASTVSLKHMKMAKINSVVNILEDLKTPLTLK